MSAQITISRDGQHYGPYSMEDLTGHLESGSIVPDDLAWMEGMEEWRPLREIVDIEGQSSAPPSIPLPTSPSSLQNLHHLWNPNAAALWCLLLTPAFGAWVHAKNWRSLGDATRAKANMIWFWATLGLLAASLVTILFSPLRDLNLSWLQLLLLLGWYLSVGRTQVNLVKGCIGDYRKKSWGMPLMVAFSGVIGLVLVAGLLSAYFEGHVDVSSSVPDVNVERPHLEVSDINNAPQFPQTLSIPSEILRFEKVGFECEYPLTNAQGQQLVTFKLDHGDDSLQQFYSEYPDFYYKADIAALTWRKDLTGMFNTANNLRALTVDGTTLRRYSQEGASEGGVKHRLLLRMDLKTGVLHLVMVTKELPVAIGDVDTIQNRIASTIATQLSIKPTFFETNGCAAVLDDTSANTYKVKVAVWDFEDKKVFLVSHLEGGSVGALERRSGRAVGVESRIVYFSKLQWRSYLASCEAIMEVLARRRGEGSQRAQKKVSDTVISTF